MIGYVTLGTNDIAKAAAFYDALLGELGAVRAMDTETFIAWAADYTGAMLSITEPFDGEPATVGNGTMVALLANSEEMVDKVYKKAIELGAQDEGEAGPRAEGFYAGYFRDPDGNKIAVFHSTQMGG